MIATVTAISWGFSTFNILPRASWSLVALISFIIFAGLVIWGLVDRNYQIERLQRQLSDPILWGKQKEHSDEIKGLIGSWMASLSVPKISEVLPGTVSPINEVKCNVRFNYLKEHLPSTKLWENHVNWDTKMQEYLDKCKRLRTEIQAAWKVDNTKTDPDFATPILEAIEGTKLHRWLIAYGTGHALEEVSHQILNVNEKNVLYGIEVGNDNTYDDLWNDKCSGLILRTEYEKLAEYFPNTITAIEAKQLYSELERLGYDIEVSLHLYLERAEYVNNHCSVCPIEQRASRKGGSRN